jgi:Uri superfamily endonuclease
MINFHDLPATSGTYVVHLSLVSAQRISVGRLGPQHFPSGDYFYVGSARGAGGLRARVGRHLRGDGARHWHIDTLRAVAEVQDVFYTVTDTPLECVWSQALAKLPDAFIPVPHFGSSDCRSGCEAHLIAFPRYTDIPRVPHTLEPITPTPIDSLHYR